MSDADRDNIVQLPVEPPEPPRAKPRLKKLRLLGILVPLALLALISTVFGMMMAVASDLPQLENDPQYRHQARNSILLDARGKPLGRLASDQNQLYVDYDQISPYMRAAIISIEDRRFMTNSGVDIKGIGRAFVQDLVQKRAAQGGSTITQQFVKNALQAQAKRTVFQKLREAALAYHLTRKWSKKKIITEYLNSIYFGNGAYGIEAAAQTYFGSDPNHTGCGTLRNPCAKQLQPEEAALLAGVVQSPTAYDPVVHPQAALRRRNEVLKAMYDQHYLDIIQYDRAKAEGLPGGVTPRRIDSKAPYFASWVRQQLVDRYGARRVFSGGLKVRTTLDLNLQNAAEKAVKAWLPGPNGPTAALVAIDNGTGEVRAMVSGTRDYSDAPFNLATQGQRQPGSSFKPFILAQALREGIGPGSVWPSRKRIFTVPGTDGKEKFVVNNFEGTYTGSRTLANALAFSDNSVFATVGIKVGTKKIARLASSMGIRTPVSSNYAMTLGGVKDGVTPLDMAHAYETFEQNGERISGTLGAADHGPVGIRWVQDGSDKRISTNRTRRIRVLPTGVAKTATQVMSLVITQGTGKRAAIGQFAAGKTGTTENYGDAWFVAFTDRLTVAVWVGYPDRLKSMATDFRGEPVEGGTFPALIWHDFMTQANTIYDGYAAADRKRRGLPPQTTTTDTTPVQTSSGTVPSEGATGTTSTPATQQGSPSKQGATGGGTGGGTANPPAATQPKTPTTPAPTPTPTPAPTPAAPPSGGGGDGTGGDGGAGGAGAAAG